MTIMNIVQSIATLVLLDSKNHKVAQLLRCQPECNKPQRNIKHVTPLYFVTLCEVDFSSGQ
jgi:hypothetical protein